MNAKPSLLVVFLVLMSSIANAEQYLCIADSATGYYFNRETKSWERARFNIDDKKYVIAEAKYWEKATYEITRLGDKIPELRCDKGFDADGVLSCRIPSDNVFEFLRFNRKNGRYLLGYLFGYFIGSPEGNENKNTPWLEIGTCSPF